MMHAATKKFSNLIEAIFFVKDASFSGDFDEMHEPSVLDRMPEFIVALSCVFGIFIGN